MPYIKPDDRYPIDHLVDSLAERITDAGHLNYTITRLIGKFLIDKGLHYETINTISGVLQKVGAEFDERVTRPYEDLKMFQNGDVQEYSKIGALIRDQQRHLPADIAPDADQLAHG